MQEGRETASFGNTVNAQEDGDRPCDWAQVALCCAQFNIGCKGMYQIHLLLHNCVTDSVKWLSAHMTFIYSKWDEVIIKTNLQFTWTPDGMLLSFQ